MPRPKTRTVLGFGIPVAVVLLLLASWAIDAGASGGRVVRNVRLDGRDVGRLDGERVLAVARRAAEDYEDTPIQIRTTEHTYRSTAGELGLSLDEARTVEAALDVGRTEAFPLRPLNWLASFADPRSVPLRFKVRDNQLALVLIALEGVEGRQPTEPVIVGTPGTVGIRGGQSGFALDPADVSRKLIAAAEGGRDPISVRTEPVEQAPTFTDEEASELAAELAFKTARPLLVKAGTTAVAVPAATQRAWLGSEPGPRSLEVTVDGERAIKDLQALVTDLGGPATDASITLVGTAVQITPSKDGFRCCGPETPDLLLGAISEGRASVEVPLIVDRPSFTTEDAQKLGIKEPVGTIVDWKGQPQVKSFTTYFAGGESRVTNIHRIADLVRGAIVEPGGTFSVNEHVGQRTIENGFVVAGAIANGEHSEEVGGGVSQFATTLFNAAFFAGLDFGDYQSHSIHFDRYPRGREATMGFPNPDLQIENTTPYGIMIWTSHTPTSVTVSFWSTQHVFGQQTGQVESPSGNCTRVTTTRTRTYTDGRTETDEVFATYRPDFGINC